MRLYTFQESALASVGPRHILAWPTGCFASGTPVLMQGGYYMDIAAIKPGDVVMSFDGKKLVPSVVDFNRRTSNQPKPMIQFWYDRANIPITATYDHPFYDGERYYPLYQLAWRKMEASQRLQLQLLCKQYGSHFDYSPVRGVTHSDNETWEGQLWPPSYRNERQDSQDTSGYSPDMDSQSERFALHKPQGLRPDQQPSGKSGMVQSEGKLDSRLGKRKANGFTQEGGGEKESPQPTDSMRHSELVDETYREHAQDRLAYPEKAIHCIEGLVPSCTNRNLEKVHTNAVNITRIEIHEAQPYYGIGVRGVHTYVVANLPVHNTGKGFSSLALYEKYAYPKPLLILAPASKAKSGDWERDVAIWFEGRELPEFHVYSYEKFSRNPTVAQYRKTGDNGIWRQWMERRCFYVIFDEIQKAKNPQSGIGKACFMVAKASSGFVGLSATPMGNGWIDAANYFKMFGFVPNITAFKRRYCNIQTFRGFPEIVGYYLTDELQSLWNRIASRINKDEALDLPPLMQIPVHFRASKEYTDVRMTRMLNGEFLDNPSAYLHALRQCSTPQKLPWLDDFLEGVSGHTVIFYSYKSEREAILELIKKKHRDRTVFRQDGERHEAPTKQEWDRLPERTITLAQYQSGGTGIELTFAHNVVYFSPTYSYLDYEQSIGRTYRNGQKRKVTLYQLCTRGTIEDEVWDAIKSKRDFSERIWFAENAPNVGKKLDK